MQTVNCLFIVLHVLALTIVCITISIYETIKDNNLMNEDKIIKLAVKKKVIFANSVFIVMLFVISALWALSSYVPSALQHNSNIIYSAELKSGEIVETTECYKEDEKSICKIDTINGNKEYVVTSYKIKNLCEK